MHMIATGLGNCRSHCCKCLRFFTQSRSTRPENWSVKMSHGHPAAEISLTNPLQRACDDGSLVQEQKAKFRRPLSRKCRAAMRPISPLSDTTVGSLEGNEALKFTAGKPDSRMSFSMARYCICAM